MTPLVLIAMLALQAPPSPLQAESARFRVDVLDRGSDDTGARLMITRKDTTRYHIVTINRALGRIASVKLRDDDARVIVVALRGFAIVEPVGRVPQDEVYGYGVTPSPDDHWVAYMRALRDESNSDVGDGIVMYDTSRTADQNRSAFPIAAERSSAAGTPVYPPAAEWKKSSGIEPARPHAGAYQWWDAPLYAAALRESAGDRLVIADVSQPAIRACSKALPPQKDRWSQATVSVRRQGGAYLVDIRSPVLSRTETIAFPPDCR